MEKTMKDIKQETTRRDLIKGALGAAAVIAASEGVSISHAASKKRKKMEFYAADGALNAEAVKTAYLDMLKDLGCPIPDVLKTDALWVCDFLQRDISKLGMGGIFWINETGTYSQNGAKAYKGTYKDQKFGYLGHEIYLLPGQLLPEHRHIGGAEGYGPKMESWQVRYGSVEFFGEYQGEGTETLISDMPKSKRPWGYGEDWFKSKYVAKRTAQSGLVYTLEDPESWHCQRAGAQGAVVTEYATYHNHVEFSKPGMEFASSPAL
jgi:D-lyxose ketol-isomerase